MVKFFANYRSQRQRQILLLSSGKKADIDLFVGDERRRGSEGSGGIQLNPFEAGSLPIAANVPFVYQVSLYASDKTVLLGSNSEKASSDTFYGLPVQVLSEGECEEYLAVSTPSSPVGNSYNSIVLVIGSQDNTTVIVTPTQDVTIKASAKGIFHVHKMTVAKFVLNKYGTLQILSPSDLTGTKVKAYHPVAVYSGHECGRIPYNADAPGCDHMVEQLPPVNVWRHNYIAVPFLRRLDNSFVKVVVAEDDTLFTAVCVDSAGTVVYNRTIGPMNTGDFYEQFVPADEYLYITSNKPLMVVHFITAKQLDEIGDPSMIILPSTDNLVNNITFYSLDPDEEDKFIHFISIIVPEEHSNPNFIILNDEPLNAQPPYLSTILETDFGRFVIYRLQLDAGYHTIRHSNPNGGFALTVYGLAEDTAYGYAPGLNQGMLMSISPLLLCIHYFFSLVHMQLCLVKGNWQLFISRNLIT